MAGSMMYLPPRVADGDHDLGEKEVANEQTHYVLDRCQLTAEVFFPFPHDVLLEVGQGPSVPRQVVRPYEPIVVDQADGGVALCVFFIADEHRAVKFGSEFD